MNNINNDPRLKNLSPIKQKLISEIANSSTSKPMEQMLPEIMQINQELSRRNIAFTKEESNLIMDILMEQASPDERRKIAMIRSMM